MESRTASGTQVSSQPPAANSPPIRFAVLHLILSFKVRAAGIVCADCLHDTQTTFLKGRLQRTQLRMKRIKVIKAHCGLRILQSWRGNRKRRSQLVIVVIAVGHDHIQRVSSTAQKNADQRLLANCWCNNLTSDKKLPDESAPRCMAHSLNTSGNQARRGLIPATRRSARLHYYCPPCHG